jgi:hypothetical protein
MSDLVKRLRESNDYYGDDAADYIERLLRELAEARAENANLLRERTESNEACLREVTRAERAEAEVAALKAALLTVLDQVDYTVGACSITNMVGACLPVNIITMARAAIDAAKEGK